MENAQAMEIARAWPDGGVKPRNRLKIVIEYIWFRLGDALQCAVFITKIRGQHFDSGAG